MSFPRSHRTALFALAGLWLVVAAAASLWFHQTGSPWADETVFVETAHDFADGFSCEKLRTYPQLLGPLTFVVYGTWERLVGDDLWRIRLLSILLALMTVILIARWLGRQTGSPTIAFWGTLVFMLNPYTIGLGTLVYTDMLAIVLFILALSGLQTRSSWWVLIGLVGALLTRQHMAFAWLGITAYTWWRWFGDREPIALRLAMSATLSCLPLLALFVFWGGLFPDSMHRAVSEAEGFKFHPAAAVLYIALIPLYTLPVVIAKIRRWSKLARPAAYATAFSLVYFAFPVKAAPWPESIDVATVGLAHRALQFTGLGFWFEQAVFFVAFWAGLVVVATLIQELIAALRRPRGGRDPLPALVVLAYLVVMPFAYLWWEKYFLPVVPVVIGWLLTPSHENRHLEPE